MRRRDLPFALGLLAGRGRAQQTEPLFPGRDYIGALDRHLTALAEAQWQARGQAIAALKSADAVRTRQRDIRARLEQQIGGLPTSKTPLNARVTGGFARDGYRVENVVFESLPGFRVTANLYLPTTGRGPYPAVLGVAGHSNNGKASATYQHAWIGFVRRGYVVLAYDPPGQGERLEQYDADTGRSRSGVGVQEHIQAGLQCLLTGSNIARYFAWDGIRAVDYLLTRTEVDSKRIAVAGNSGGGTQAAYLAVLEPRLAAIISSCYITRWRELWAGPGPQDTEQVFAGFIADGLDFSDYLLAAAPKPFLITSAIRDYFPIAGARATHEEAVRLYERLNASEKTGFFEYDDTHGWSKPRREAAYKWLDRWLLAKKESAPEPPIRPEPESLLHVTPTGQLATSLGSETVQSLNARLAAELAAKRPPVTREVVARRLTVNPAMRAGLSGVMGHTEFRANCTVLRVELGGAPVPALLFTPKAPAGPLPALIHVDARGMAANAAPGGELEQLAGTGRIVLAIDPRGIGEAGPRQTGRGYSPLYQLAARTWLLGRSLAGMQVEDLLHGVRYLQQHTPVDSRRIALLGRHAAGPLALMAAALEPAVERVALEGSLLSLGDLAASRFHEGWTNLIVPGILRDFDLPDLLPLIAPRPVWLVSPAQPNGSALPIATVRQRKPWGTTPSVEIRERPEGESAATFYTPWLT